jgi:DNA polymerase-3 subunit epsilon
VLTHPVLALRDVSDEIYEASDLYIERFSEKRLWLFDLEATGLDTRRERVTQIAGIPMVGGRLLEERAFSQYVHPGEGVQISAEVQELTGITPETLRGQPPFATAWQACVDAALGCDYWVGQSVFEFDVPLLEAEFARHAVAGPLPPILDTVVVATALLGEPEGRWSTSALVGRFQADVQGLRRHDALNDVKILAAILAPMIDLIRREHGDRLEIPRDRPIPIRRHPPIQSDA